MQQDGRKRSVYIRNLIVNYKASGLLTLKIQRKTVCYDFQISLIEIRTKSVVDHKYSVFVLFRKKEKKHFKKLF